LKTSRLSQFAVPIGVVLIIMMMVVPVPAAILDFLIAMNITAALVIVLVSMYVKRPLDFSSFPSLLLVATLFRLALNISATRLVLSNGYAGSVINAFGHFVIGGSLVIGLVIFAILLVIQFVVITNGAGRIAEVGARFTLDAMPGKQMAIDADLNSGTINEKQARIRRAEVAAEADFYGSMDGASKFVKGDAIAAIIITLINLVGGLTIGIVSHHLSFGTALNTYSLLSVGDGLVSQIPALLLSVSTGLIVTRSSGSDDMGSAVAAQLGAHRRALQIAGCAAIGLCLVPGLPKLPFLLVGGALLVFATRVPKEGAVAAAAEAAEAAEQAAATTPDSSEALMNELSVDPLELTLAADLIDLVDGPGADLLDRVRALRRKLALELGVVMPPVRTRDNVDLPLSMYAVLVNGVEVARGQAPAGCILAIGDGLDGLPGRTAREPVFGLEEVAALTHSVKRTHPVVVEDLTPALLSLGEIQRVLHALLDEGAPIRDLVRIYEALSVTAKGGADPDRLLEAARAAIGPAITAQYLVDGRLDVLTVDPRMQQTLVESVRPADGGLQLIINPGLAEALVTDIQRQHHALSEAGGRPVLACPAPLRLPLRRLIRIAVPDLPVLSYSELSGGNARIETVGVISDVRDAVR
jgi:flagellar biosynthesis protein FlhA